MIKEVSLHMAFFCISVCISLSLQSTVNQFMWQKKKRSSFLHYPLFIRIFWAYICAGMQCVCVGLIVMSISWDNVTAVRGLNKKNGLLAPVIP